ncbi:MAG TPA: hypothetical protein EYG91_06310 [Aquifex aeolicus]|nr:hypothetical protein [Aquifex aeolicus]
MALKRKFHVEDVILIFTVFATFIYPFIITFFILYKESVKERIAQNILDRVTNVFLSLDCKDRLVELVPYIYFPMVSKEYMKSLKKICSKTSGKSVLNKTLRKENEELVYILRINGGSLKLIGRWENDKDFRIILIDYD